jgi:cysteinyl-tRNA synthetase
VERTQRWEEKESNLYDFLAKTEEDIHNALADDFDTTSSIERLSDLVSATNTYIQGNNSATGGRKAFLIRKIASFISKTLKVFGIQEGDSDLTLIR